MIERSASGTVMRCRRVLSAVFMITVKDILIYGVSYITNPPRESFVKDVHFNLTTEINEQLRTDISYFMHCHATFSLLMIMSNDICLVYMFLPFPLFLMPK